MRELGPAAAAAAGPSMAPVVVVESSVHGAGGGGGHSGDQERSWKAFNTTSASSSSSSSVNNANAVSLGFVATAILISMFLLMAIFERFLRPTITSNSNSNSSDDATAATGTRIGSQDLEPHRLPNFFSRSAKLDFSPDSPKLCQTLMKTEKLLLMSIYAKGVSVLMPGNSIPTFIAHPAPAPAPCPPEQILWPSHHDIPTGGSTSSSS